MIRKVVLLGRRAFGLGIPLKLGSGAKLRKFRVRAGPGDTIVVGEKSIVEGSLIVDRSPAVIRIGSRTFVGRSRLIAAQMIEIGDDVLISWDVTVVDHDSHALDFPERRNDVVEWGQGRKDWRHVAIAPVKICDKAWLGFGATILKGVTIGEGAVVAAKSVVTKDVAPWTLVAGNPARMIRSLKANGVEE